MGRLIFSFITIAILMQACASAPPSQPYGSGVNLPAKNPSLPADTIAALADRTAFHQQDPRWGGDVMGGSGGTLSKEGCLVTAAAMALSNLGFTTNPSDLNARLKAQGGYTSRGWLVWSGLERVSGGRAKTRFYTQADASIVRGCLADGYYPLLRFTLPSRRAHWVMVVADTKRGFYIRDPMVTSSVAIPLASRTPKFDAVRCVGVDRA